MEGCFSFLRAGGKDGAAVEKKRTKNKSYIMADKTKLSYNFTGVVVWLFFLIKTDTVRSHPL